MMGFAYSMSFLSSNPNMPEFPPIPRSFHLSIRSVAQLIDIFLSEGAYGFCGHVTDRV